MTVYFSAKENIAIGRGLKMEHNPSKTGVRHNFKDFITFDDLSETIPNELRPFLDRDDCDESKLDHNQIKWREFGYLILPKFIPEPLVNLYVNLREKLPDPDGWRNECPYQEYSEIRAICTYRPLMDILKSLIGHEMMLHLNSTGWVSSERNWHQADYLNPPHVVSHYLGVWFALDDIHPDSGPFEFVPGSHKWPLLRRERVLRFSDPKLLNNPSWPTITDEIVAPVIEKEIMERGAKRKQFLGKNGDVLIWHGSLVHRESKPTIPGMTRKSLIAHYSSENHRPDMPVRGQVIDDEWNSRGICAVFPENKVPEDQKI